MNKEGMQMALEEAVWQGYGRGDGSVGIRNKVLVRISSRSRLSANRVTARPN